MTPADALAALEAAGTAQNRKVYARHGIGPAMFGVSYAALGGLRKKIKRDHALALALWASGNHDARILATMIADPAALDIATLEAWIGDCDNYVLMDAVTRLAGETPHAEPLARAWTARPGEEYRCAAGWQLVGVLAWCRDGRGDDWFLARLAEIEAGIGTALNRVRHGMNGALIGIGSRNALLRRAAEAAARRIGPVEVDHGETGCETPAAIPYLERIWARRKGGEAGTAGSGPRAGAATARRAPRRRKPE